MRVILSIALIVMGFSSFRALAIRQVSEAILAEWQLEGGRPMVRADLSVHLNDKQRDLINSGFSAITQVFIRRIGSGQKVEATPDLQLSCQIELDLWEERYEISFTSSASKKKSAQTFSEVAKLCLSISLKKVGWLGELMNEGGQLLATIIVTQSQADASNVRDWLIKQQAGVMQEVFSHMLGDLKMSERMDLILAVPPLSDPNKSQLRVQD